jgi:hypothetical protein
MLCEEILDEEFPLWDRPRRGGRIKDNPHPAARNAWGQMSIAWVNLGSMLINLGVEAWTIPPLASRTGDGTGTCLTQFDKDGHLDVSPVDAPHLLDRRVPPDVIRIVERPTEARYTLAEARELLQLCQEHQWQVETGEHGEPFAAVCSNCGERRLMR